MRANKGKKTEQPKPACGASTRKGWKGGSALWRLLDKKTNDRSLRLIMLVSYGRDIGKGTQGLSMLASRTAFLLYRRLLIVVSNLRCEREWREG